MPKSMAGEEVAGDVTALEAITPMAGPRPVITNASHLRSADEVRWDGRSCATCSAAYVEARSAIAKKRRDMAA